MARGWAFSAPSRFARGTASRPFQISHLHVEECHKLPRLHARMSKSHVEIGLTMVGWICLRSRLALVPSLRCLEAWLSAIPGLWVEHCSAADRACIRQDGEVKGIQSFQWSWKGGVLGTAFSSITKQSMAVGSAYWRCNQWRQASRIRSESCGYLLGEIRERPDSVVIAPELGRSVGMRLRSTRASNILHAIILARLFSAWASIYDEKQSHGCDCLHNL
ncbi:uncharacterized protein MYCFIDRAFT_180147 [Pseudocercospora fijiensis CIRAD86]|uniref:Uncharacterized protein n=1 Tax=Pseudocercospora fijiensis (strain CIRAD86) TaxID=383855 RepID=M2ZDG2_PSEFD|nr:uncharacterized protein MYCFIDRAFT_180147 [Pseudocercospora fijiensis CIRAD86]EME77144.1 hypothetical protein MYCFIDRAFT_180147 [Pseudocercospora fijiensis CIRAD86]